MQCGWPSRTLEKDLCHRLITFKLELGSIGRDDDSFVSLEEVPLISVYSRSGYTDDPVR
jgi:hypothetical protein